VRHLELAVNDDAKFPAECDGCSRKMQLGERYLTSIESCCGTGCVRSLCAECVHWSAEALKSSPRVITRTVTDGIRTKDGAA
jgi:hypothetical protein